MSQRTDFVGREIELSQLRKMEKKKTASFVVIKGRRRVGKSRLVDQFSKDFTHYYKFEGLAPEEGVTPAHQLEEFCIQISRQFKTPKIHYTDWSDAFWAVGERVQSGKTLLFFDELSWMGNESPTFLAKLKTAWDNMLSKNPTLIFIACSSASSWIEKNLLSSTGFLGRISLTITLEELPLSDCNQFWPNHISPFEKLKVLSVTGGIPRYLEEIDPKSSAEDNIKRLCFTRDGLLVTEFKKLFSDLFIRKSKFYEKIIEILSTGPKEQADIQNQLSQKKDQEHYGRTPEYLWELEEVGFITRSFTWNVKTGVDSKLSQYRLQDNYLRFYLKYIKKNMSKIKKDLFVLKSLTGLPEWNSMMGFQFENLVLSNKKLIHHALNISADEIVNENPFFQKKTRHLPGCQIDYMIQTKFNTLYLCEIKFSKNPIDTSVIHDVQKKIERVKFAKGFSHRPVLIHVNGVTEDLTDHNYFSAIIDFSSYL